MPTEPFGPWTTSLTTGSQMELSAFWKRRLTRLATVSHGQPGLGRRHLSSLFSLMLTMGLIPLLKGESERFDGTDRGTIVGAVDDLQVAAEQSTPAPADQSTTAPAHVEPAVVQLAPVAAPAPHVAPAPPNAAAPPRDDAGGPPAARDSAAPTATPAQAIHRAKGSVVRIETERNARPGEVVGDIPGAKIPGGGSGLIIDERGYILTTQSIIADTTLKRVTLLDGTSFAGALISYDIKHDLAMVKIEPAQPLVPAPIGTSAAVRKGDPLVAIGAPRGNESSAAIGVIQSLVRDLEINEHQSYRNLLQTDAPLTAGDGGGPFVNLDGEVIGIIVAIRAEPQRLGFAIPIDDVRKYTANLLDIRQLKKTRHGITAHDVKTGLLSELVVDSLEPNSPAAAAGFKAGDVITQVGRHTVVDRADLELALLEYAADVPIEVAILRNKENKTLAMRLAKAVALEVKAPVRQPAATETDVSARIWKSLGLRLQNAAPEQLKSFHPRYKGGLAILEVRPDSPAAQGGMRIGDVLVGVSIWETTKVNDVKWALEQPKIVSAEEPLKFFVVRGTELIQGETRLAQPLHR